MTLNMKKLMLVEKKVLLSKIKNVIIKIHLGSYVEMVIKKSGETK